MGHVAVLAVAIGIFVGTLSLGRQPVAAEVVKAVTTEPLSADKAA